MNRIEFGDCREIMRRWAADGVKAQTCVTSPPYFGLRDYGHEGQIGLEATPDEYVAKLVEVFRCVRDVLTGPYPRWVDPATGMQVARKATKNRRDAEMRDLGYEKTGSFYKHKFVLQLNPKGIQ